MLADEKACCSLLEDRMLVVVDNKHAGDDETVAWQLMRLVLVGEDVARNLHN